MVFSSLNLFLRAAFGNWVLLSMTWVLSVAITNASIIDPLWPVTFVLQAIVYADAAYVSYHGQLSERAYLTLILVTIWGIRLSLYLLYRNWGEGEDYRYQYFRKQYQPYWWKSYFQVFLLQGIFSLFIGLPLLFAITSPVHDYVHGRPAELELTDYLGAVVWLVGFFFEAVGDYQLMRFKANPASKGKVLDTGVWKYTRHPNYFGDAAVWWGIYLVAVGSPKGIQTLVSPTVMTYLLMNISGVPLTERRMKKTRAGFAEYVARTPSFFPWFPSSPKSASKAE